MDIRPIRTQADYRAAMREISTYFDNEPKPGTPDGDRFDILLTLTEAYEAKHFPVDLPRCRGHQIPHGTGRPYAQRPRTHDRAHEPGL